MEPKSAAAVPHAAIECRSRAVRMGCAYQPRACTVRTAYRVPCVPRAMRTAYIMWHPTGGAGQALLLGGAGVCTAYYLPIYYLPIYDSLLAYILTAYYGSTPAWRSSTRPLSCSTCARGSMCYSAHSGRWCVALTLALTLSLALTLLDDGALPCRCIGRIGRIGIAGGHPVRPMHECLNA
eukprot:scaffold24606_cov63-Phaeocystis_antarctica.AAC.3